MRNEELWVIVAPCVIVQAFAELLRDGTPEIHPFPPADRMAPAGTVLSISGSERVRRAGIQVVIDERVLGIALAALRDGVASSTPSELTAFEVSIRERLFAAIETPERYAPSTFDAVVAEWGPDIIVAVDQGTRRRFAEDFAVMYPGQWVKHAITLSRAL